MNRCLTCRHWEAFDEDWGFCFRFDTDEVGRTDAGALARLRPTVSATLETSADFGCVQQEPTDLMKQYEKDVAASKRILALHLSPQREDS